MGRDRDRQRKRERERDERERERERHTQRERQEWETVIKLGIPQRTKASVHDCNQVREDVLHPHHFRIEQVLVSEARVGGGKGGPLLDTLLHGLVNNPVCVCVCV